MHLLEPSRSMSDKVGRYMTMNKITVFANGANNIKELTAGVKALGSKVVLITSAKAFGCADEAFCYEDSSVPCILKSLSDFISDSDIIICESSCDGRLVAGYAAAKLGVSPLCDVSSVTVTGSTVQTQRLVFGGSAVKTESSSLPAVIVVGSGVFDAAAEPVDAKIEDLPSQPDDSVEQIGTRELDVSSVNLAAAKRIVGIGRGLSSADNIPCAEKLAAKLGAEVGCSRPVAEEEHWYPKERYIGVSGCMLKPNFYMAIGISGQIQHMVGINQANVIFAVNKDEKAPIVSQADYTLIGDAVELLPILVEKF